MRKSVVNILMIVLILSIFNGCATIFNSKIKSVPVSSEPSGAEVFLNGISMGTTPMVLNLYPNKTHNIELKYEGYNDEIIVIKSKIGMGWAFLDFLGGLAWSSLIAFGSDTVTYKTSVNFTVALFAPLIIDAFTNSWSKLDKNVMHVVLYRKED